MNPLKRIKSFKSNGIIFPDIPLKPNLNYIYGRNFSGKSTLFAHLKYSMFDLVNYENPFCYVKVGNLPKSLNLPKGKNLTKMKIASIVTHLKQSLADKIIVDNFCLGLDKIYCQKFIKYLQRNYKDKQILLLTNNRDLIDCVNLDDVIFLSPF